MIVKKTKSSKAITETAETNLYGLDIDILKSLNLYEEAKNVPLDAQDNASDSDNDQGNKAN